MPHSVPFERATKQSSPSADMSSSILSGTVTKKRSSSPANITSSVMSGRVRKNSSAAANQTAIINGVRVEEYARTVLSAEANVDGRKNGKAEDVVMDDIFSDETIQYMTMNILSNCPGLGQDPPEAASVFDFNFNFSWEKSLSSNLSAFEIDPFLQDSSTRTLSTYRKPLPPPAFPCSRYEGWCLRDKRKIYRMWKFNESSREKDPVDRLIHWESEKTTNNGKGNKREWSLYFQKLDMIISTTKYVYDSFDLCKERAKALQHEPVNSSPLRLNICSADQDDDESQAAEEIEDFFEQWLSRYEELHQLEAMNWQLGAEQPVSSFVEQQPMDWVESGALLPSVPFDQRSMDWARSEGTIVFPPAGPETVNGNGDQLDDLLKDLILPSLAVPKPSIG